MFGCCSLKSSSARLDMSPDTVRMSLASLATSSHSACFCYPCN
ncbi:hypothetical protein LINGRAHAP2_LOCUS20798 [Linum grandiflorum]